MKPDWSELTVLVTGASKGVGRATVQALAGRGARIGCVARSEQDLTELCHALGSGAVTEWACADVSVRDQIEGAIDDLSAKLGPIDVLVNNAGVGLYGPVARLDPADAERLMRINYLGTMYATTAVLPGMIDRRRGHIVNVASIAGLLGNPFEAAYSASKFAVVGFTEALAVETAPFGVRVSMVNTGPVDTGFFATRGHPYQRRRPRPLPPEDVAAAVIGLLEKGNQDRTLPGGLRLAVAVRAVLPRVYLSGARRSFRRELAVLAAELGGAGLPS